MSGAARVAVIGIVGGIGAGKSRVAAAFAELGCVVSDSDAQARAALNEPAVRDELVRWWGAGVLDSAGKVDRAKVAAIVFAQPPERQRLEALVHPRVHEARAKEYAMARATGAAGLIIDAPLLLEAGIDRECDALVFVDAPRSERVARVKSRGWDDAELARREAAQWPLARKRAACGYVIENRDGRTDQVAQARVILEAIRQAIPTHD